LTDVIAGLVPAFQVYFLANCFTWMTHQVRRDIREGVRRRNMRRDIREGKLNTQFVVLNSFQDLKKKIPKQVRHPFLFMSGLTRLSITLTDVINCRA
ncbi:MAG: hypothetical protein IJ689_03110, partial [Alphaproteobacteria bacterium]|nr:hypothetical protein [Alphaproteobacteria bacterium]